MEPATEKSDTGAFVRDQAENNLIKVPDWFHEAMVDHAFRVDATINRHAAKASTEMESVKLDLWKLQQQQQHHKGGRSTHDSNNAGADQLKRLGRRVEEMAESLQHQQITLQEVLERMKSVVQATAIAQRRCDDADGRLRDALNSGSIATHDNSACKTASNPSTALHVPLSDQSGRSKTEAQSTLISERFGGSKMESQRMLILERSGSLEQQLSSGPEQQQTLKACRELEATISAKMEEDEKAMRNFVEVHVSKVQDFAVVLEGSIKGCNARMEHIEAGIETVVQVLQPMGKAVKKLPLERCKTTGLSRKTTGLSKKTKKNQNMDSEVDDKLMEKLDDKLMAKLEEFEHMKPMMRFSKTSAQTSNSHVGDPLHVFQDQVHDQTCSSATFSYRLTRTRTLQLSVPKIVSWMRNIKTPSPAPTAI